MAGVILSVIYLGDPQIQFEMTRSFLPLNLGALNARRTLCAKFTKFGQRIFIFKFHFLFF